MAEIYISLGSNLNPIGNIRTGLAALRAEFGPLERSPVYRSDAVGFTGPKFLNCVVGTETTMPPLEVREVLRAIEDDHERRRQPERMVDRTLDLDLLLYADYIFERDGLRLPRPEILEQAFVLKPLADLIGERKHPETGRSFDDHWQGMAPGAPQLTEVMWSTSTGAHRRP